VVGGARPGDVRHIVASPDRARAHLGFEAHVEFTEGVTAFAGEPQRAPVDLPA
jgi:dTDP-L-rhamnose 4-epimerase